MFNKRKYNLSLALIFILLLLVELCIPMLGDDGLFMKYPLTLKWLITRYNSWSSRIIIECLLVLLSKHILLFKLLNAGVFVLLIDTLSNLTIGRNVTSLALLFILFLFLPITLFLSAGLAATSLNYLWPITFAIFALCNLNTNSSWAKKLFLLILILFATNQEQVCIGLLFFFICKILKDVYTHKKISKASIGAFLITLGSTINIMLCPGNKVRSLKSVSTIFPEFAKYSFWDKLNLGISNTGKILFYRQNFLIIVFLVFLVIVPLILRNSKIMYAVPGIIVAILVIPFNVFLSTLTVNGYNLTTFNKYLFRSQKNPTLNGIFSLLINLMNRNVSIVWNILFVVIILLISLAIYFTLRSKTFVVYFILGLGTHIMMGFSPSIYKSGDRTAFIFYIVVIYLILIMTKKIFQDKCQKLRN